MLQDALSAVNDPGRGDAQRCSITVRRATLGALNTPYPACYDTSAANPTGTVSAPMYISIYNFSPSSLPVVDGEAFCVSTALL